MKNASKEFSHGKISLSNQLLIAAVLLLSLGATYFLWKMTNQLAEIECNKRFSLEVDKYLANIEQRNAHNLQLLTGMRAMASATEKPNPEHFQRFVSALTLYKNYLWIHGMGFAMNVSHADKAKHLHQMRQQGHAGYDILPGGTRTSYTPIILRQGSGTQVSSGMGYDIQSDPARWKAMERARDTDQASMTEPVKSVMHNRSSENKMAEIYLPVYRQPLPPGSLKERRTNIAGWVFITLTVQDYFAAAQSSYDHRLDVKILDDANDFSPQSQTASQPLKKLKKFEHNGRTWWLLFSAEKNHAAFNLRSLPVAVAVSGCLVSLLMALIVYLLARCRAGTIAFARKANNPMMKSQELLNLALEGMGEGVWEWDITNDEVSFSRQWKAMLGYADADIDNHLKEWSSRIHPADRANVMDSLNAYFSGLTPHYINEHRLQCKDGTWKWILDRGAIVSFSDDGKPARMLGTHTDISHRRELENQWQLASLVYNHMIEAVTVTDHNGDIVAVNHAFTTITGYDSDEVLGKNPRILKSGIHDSRFYEDMWHAICSTGQWIGEIWNKRKDGTLVPEILSINTIYNPDGSVYRYVAIFHDLSERKKVEKLIEEATTQRITEREAERKRIAREIHDDLGQRLTLHRMDILSLQKTLKAPSREERDLLERMRFSVDESIGIVRHVVSNLRPPVLDIGLIEAIKWLVRDFESRTDITCLFNDETSGGKTYNDEQSIAIFRIVQESLSNVAKHSKASLVEIDLAIKEDVLTLTIEDNGVGINPDQKKFLDSFGLVGIRERVSMFKGQFIINSAPGQGTVLRITIPIQTKAELDRHD